MLQIHGGPATLYGWSLMWEWQLLAANGISVYACNPRGLAGIRPVVPDRQRADWGDGPMRDVMAGLDSLIDDGLVDGDRMGVTGGSYGGYLTSWIVGHTDRFKAAVTCRSVNDLISQMLSGDIGGPTFGLYVYGAHPVGRLGPVPPALAADLRDGGDDAAAHPACGEGPALHDHPGRGAVRRPALAAQDRPADAHARTSRTS